MDNETKSGFIAVGVALALLFIFRPAKTGYFPTSKGPSAPAVAKVTDKEFENAQIGIKALRAAIRDNASESDKNGIKSAVWDDYKVKLTVTNNRIYAKNAKGQAIANEK